MNLFGQFLSWTKDRLHVNPHQLKGTPGIGDPSAAANHVNALLGAVIDAAEPQGLHLLENALHVKASQLHNAPGIGDHEAAAGAINAIVREKIEGDQ